MAETRKKTHDLKNEEIRSPDQLGEYLRVTNPGVWAVFAVVFLIIAAFFAWSLAGTIETLTDAKAVVSDGSAELIILSSEGEAVQKGMTVRVDKKEYSILDVRKDEYGRTVAFTAVDLPDGSYDAKIVTESITPISFLLQN
jgi:hypothetical protein